MIKYNFPGRRAETVAGALRGRGTTGHRQGARSAREPGRSDGGRAPGKVVEIHGFWQWKQVPDSRVRYGERKGGVKAVRMRHKWGHALVKVEDGGCKQIRVNKGVGLTQPFSWSLNRLWKCKKNKKQNKNRNINQIRTDTEKKKFHVYI